MYASGLPYPTFTVGTNTANSGTAFASLIPPCPGATEPPFIYNVKGTSAPYLPNWLKWSSAAWTHIDALLYTIAGTAHSVYLMRPLNFTSVATAALTAQTVINIAYDPGIYSTNYAYPTPGGVVVNGSGVPPCQVTDNAIAGGDYVAYQLPDGTWFMDTVASVSTLAITMTTNVPAGTTATALPIGTPFFFYGIFSDKDPATGLAHWKTTPTISTNRVNLLGTSLNSGFQTIHSGDPVIFYSANSGSAGVLDEISGKFDKH